MTRRTAVPIFLALLVSVAAPASEHQVAEVVTSSRVRVIDVTFTLIAAQLPPTVRAPCVEVLPKRVDATGAGVDDFVDGSAHQVLRLRNRVLPPLLPA